MGSFAWVCCALNSPPLSRTGLVLAKEETVWFPEILPVKDLWDQCSLRDRGPHRDGAGISAASETSVHTGAVLGSADLRPVFVCPAAIGGGHKVFSGGDAEDRDVASQGGTDLN